MVKSDKIKQYENTILKAVFLIIIGLAASLVKSPIIGCQIKKFLLENRWARHTVLIIILYFSISLTSDNNLVISPWLKFGIVLLLYSILILVNKMSYKMTILCFFILITIFIIMELEKYFFPTDWWKKYINDIQTTQKEVELNNKYYQFISYLIIILQIILGILIIIGVSLYWNYQRKLRPDNFSIKEFLLGQLECESIKY